MAKFAMQTGLRLRMNYPILETKTTTIAKNFHTVHMFANY